MLEIMISSSVLILVLALLRLALRNRISARLQYALWLLVLVRLLVPVSFFHSPVSVAEAAAPVTERVWYASHMVIYTRNTAPVPEQAFSDPSEYEEGSVVTPGHALLLRDALLLTWYVGMVVMAVWFLIVNIRLARRLRRDRQPYAMGYTPPVYVAGGIPSPCLFGVFRPAVYLTEQAAADPVQVRQIVAHEKTHLRHGDMIWALLRSVCLVVWWFNPLVWLAAALSRQDGELACDEGTIKALGEEARFDYGRTLVGMARVGARPSDLLCGATTMTGGKKSLKERVARIADAPKMSVTVAVIVLLIAAVAVGCTFSGAAKTEEAVGPVEPEIAVETAQQNASASDAADTVNSEAEVLGGYDREYWEEVDRELASFAYPADIEVFLSPYFEFDEALPEDDVFGPLTLEDYIYGTDSWQFRYNGETIANEPAATIIVHDADGRELWIMDDADALMIEEADSSITWVDYGGMDVDCADMIQHLLPWARGEDPTEEELAAQRLEARQTAVQDTLGVLGRFGLAGLEPVQIDGGVDTPFWADHTDPRDPAGLYITLFYGTDDMSADLRYERIQWNGDDNQPLGAESLALCRSSFLAVNETITDVRVGDKNGFVTDGSVYAGPRIVWYDADNDLLFSLIAFRFDTGEGYTPAELIALAERVSPL